MQSSCQYLFGGILSTSFMMNFDTYTKHHITLHNNQVNASNKIMLFSEVEQLDYILHACFFKHVFTMRFYSVQAQV
jgi:hypothetical protein